MHFISHGPNEIGNDCWTRELDTIVHVVLTWHGLQSQQTKQTRNTFVQQDYHAMDISD